MSGWEELGEAVGRARDGLEGEDAGAGDEDGDVSQETRGKRAKMRSTRIKVPWPVVTLRVADISHAAVEDFLRHAPRTNEQTGEKQDLGSILKRERVRWHPDKVQQRYGSLELEPSTMKSVTAVFQIIDRLWTEEKERN